jgi:hypothetical protein
VIKKRGYSILVFFFLGILILPHFAFQNPMGFSPGCVSIPLSFSQIEPYFWEIKLVISSTGDYRIYEGERSNVGHFSFVLLWTGCMEQDMDDYLIYHENSELLEWKAQEIAQFPEASQIISEEYFSGKPGFDFHYILRREENLHFDFQVEGFSVPQDKSDHKFYLTLPSSYENMRHFPLIDYNAFLLQGSNSIHIEEEEIYHHPIEKTYCWTWEHRQSLGRKKRPISFINSHDVKVVLTIIPHYLPQS